MKFLLVAINSKYIHRNLAIYSLKANAGELSSCVETVEYTINQNRDAILQDIYERKPDVIGFSCYIWNYEYVEALTRELHKILPEVPIWLGGPEVSFRTERELKRFPTVKGIMAGEGEEIFRQLLYYYEKGEPDLKKIQGISYREEDRICENPPASAPALNRLFSPPFSEQGESRIVYYESSRGCPFRCAYCLSSLDKNMRFRDPELVKKELSVFLQKKVPQVKFLDRTFNCREDHCVEIWKYLQKEDNGVTNFHFEIAAELLTPKELDILKNMRPGAIQLEIGVQSVNPETLQAICRPADFKKLSEMVEKIRDFQNIHQHLDLIAGLPYEDYESFGRSFDAVYRLRPNQLQLGFLKVLKGSPMYDMAEKYGISYHGSPPYEVLFTKWLSYEDIIRLKKIEEVLEIYYNSGQFPALTAYGERFFPSPFSMYEALGDFYRKEGKFQESTSRSERGYRLYEFIREYSGLEEEAKALAAWDMYGREKCKTRPEFLLSQEPFKKELAEFLRQEAKEHKLFPEYEGEPYRSFLHHVHGEAFSIDPEALLKTGERKPGLWFYFFDYEHRNPLTRQAEIRKIQVR